MKNCRSTNWLCHHAVVALTIVFLASTDLRAQVVVNADLRAIGFNGMVTIRATNMSTYSTYFSPNNGKIDLDFYFAEDDPRNGTYLGVPIIQPNGQVYIGYPGLPYQQGDVLSFATTEVTNTSTIKYYVFNNGDFMLGPVGPINVCPYRFSCSIDGIINTILIYFDPNQVVLDFSKIAPFTLSIPNANLSISRDWFGFNVQRNAIVIKLKDIDCAKAMQGSATFTINGITCNFQNGQLVCPPLVNIPENMPPSCALYFENCALDLIDLLNDIKYTLPCQQWVDYNLCSTSTLIWREGQVAIGSTVSAATAALSVKNGIITDRVKVTNNGWGDHVFEEGYDLMPLEELEAYIAKYHHLPNTPSARIIEAAGGFELGELTINHQIKIEEIFLHLIQLEAETEALEAQLFWYEQANKVQRK